MSASRVMAEKVQWHSQIDPVTDSVLTEFRGDSRLESVVVRNSVTGAEEELTPFGVFVFIGLSPNTSLVEGLVDQDDEDS